MGTKKTIRVSRQLVRIAAIHFATTRHGSTDVHALYEESDHHPLLPGMNLHAWSKGAKVTDPEWTEERETDSRACYTRNRPLILSVKLASATIRELTGTLHVAPTLDGSSRHLLPVSIPFTYPASVADHWVNLTLGGNMPDEVGRYTLSLAWGISGKSVGFHGPKLTKHKIYSIYGMPLDPIDWDEPAAAVTTTTRETGTLSGTRKRLDHLMALLGGKDRRHAVATQSDLVELFWKLHVGVNDTPGVPPYFDGAHSAYLNAPRAPGAGTSQNDKPIEFPLMDQWLAWVHSESPHWNSASCIGHVQLAKTMLAAIGLHAQRAWVFPHTSQLPSGDTVSFADTDLYCRGIYDKSKTQMATLWHRGTSYRANAILIERPKRKGGTAWENFEACLVSPTGKFLTGGYATTRNPPSFRTNKGFNTATELLDWWCNTFQHDFGKRFMVWAHVDKDSGDYHLWDVEGTHYDFSDYLSIRENGKQLPPVKP